MILKVVLSLVLNAIMLGLILWAYSKTKPSYFTETAGIIGPNKTTVFIFVMTGFLITSGGLILYTNHGIGPLSAMLILIGGTFFIGSIFGFSSGYDLVWNEHGISGLSKQFPFNLKKHRTFIPWDNIKIVKENALQNFYIESADGRKIFWNYAYDGNIAFQKVLIDKLGQRFQLR